MKLHVGTSGFSYKEWKGTFYPDRIKSADMLAWYAERLSAVELNNTFYRMPRESVVEGWAKQVPEHFRFAVKASRRITHIKRLKEVEEETNYLLSALSMLGGKLGFVLFQLPPNFKVDLDRLDAFAATLPSGAPIAFEFRHESWEDAEVHARLGASGFALCQSDVDDAPEPDLIPTSKRGYLRLRRAAYDSDALMRWIDRICEQPWEEVHVFFKHEDEGVGPALATDFRTLWDQRGAK